MLTTPLFYPDTKFERFGYFRNERVTYDENRGETDFLDYYANRHDMWDTSHGTDECATNEQCGSGSRCDTLAGLCTLPFDERTEKPIVYVKTVNFPGRFDEQTHSFFELPGRYLFDLQGGVSGKEVGFGLPVVP